jgi:enoyl-CoA hydratase/carnithine racemase
MKLINRIVPRERLFPEAESLAYKIAGWDQRTVQAIKQAVSRGLDLPLEEGLKLESRLASS